MKNKALKVLFLNNGIFVFGAGLLGPLYAVFVATIDKNILAISFTWFVFLLSTNLFLLIVRKNGDAVKEKEYLLLAGYLIRALVWFSFPLTTTLEGLIWRQVFLGLGEALGTPAYDAIFAQHLDTGKYIQEYTNWKFISNLLGAVAVVLGGLVANTYGFNTLFFLMGSFALVSFLGILLKPRKLL